MGNIKVYFNETTIKSGTKQSLLFSVITVQVCSSEILSNRIVYVVHQTQFFIYPQFKYILRTSTYIYILSLQCTLLFIKA